MIYFKSLALIFAFSFFCYLTDSNQKISQKQKIMRIALGTLVFAGLILTLT